MAGLNAHAPALTARDGGSRKASPDGMTAERVGALVEENRRLRGMVVRMDAEVAFRRLDFLFRVVASADRFGPDFVSRCVSEIEESLALPGRPADGGAKEGGDGPGEGR